MVCTRSTPVESDGGAGDDNNNNPEGSPRTSSGMIGMKSYPEPAEFDDVDRQDNIGLYAQAQWSDGS